jgi:hypothetical protein
VIGRISFAGIIVVLAGTQAGFAQAALNDTDEGEETITLSEDNAPYVFRNASGGEVTFYGQFNPTWWTTATGTRGWASASSSR